MKFQQDLLKAADERDGYKHKFFNYPWFETDDKIFICPQGYYFIAILKVQFYMDKEKVFKNITPINGKSFLNPDNLQMATDTHTIVVADVKAKMKLHKFVIGDEVIFLDENNLKYFDLEDSTFKGTNRKNPIYIYENEEMVGMVLPVNYKEGGITNAGN